MLPGYAYALVRGRKERQKNPKHAHHFRPDVIHDMLE
jgi:hypothetical protein